MYDHKNRKPNLNAVKSDFDKGWDDRRIQYKRYYTTLLISRGDVLSSGKCWVYLQVTVVATLQEGKNVTEKKIRKKFNTEIQVKPDEWDTEKEATNDFKSNTKLRAFRADLETKIERILKNEVFTTVTDDLKALQNLFAIGKAKEKIRQKSIVDYVDEYITYRKEKHTSRGTLKEFTSLRNRLAKFQEEKKETIIFDTITISLSDRLIKYWSEKKFHPNTIKKNFEIFKTVLNYYYDRKEDLNLNLIDKFKSKDFGKVQEISTDPTPLNDAEIELIVECDLNKKKNEELKEFEKEFKKGKIETHKKHFHITNIENKFMVMERTRKQVLLQLSTGLRVSDLFKVRPSNIKGQLIVMRPAKTLNVKDDNTIYIPLNSISRAILKEYKYDSSGLKISSQNYNKNIKELLKIVGINEMIERYIFKGLRKPN